MAVRRRSRALIAAACLLLTGCGESSTIPALPVSVAPVPSATDWQLNGSATVIDGRLQLTDASTADQVGSAFWPTVHTAAATVTVTFDLDIGDGSGADGLTLAVLDADLAAPTALGDRGGALGWSGLPGFAVAVDTFQNGPDPSYSTIGLVTGFDPAEPDHLQWTSFSAAEPRLRGQTRHVEVVVTDDRLTVTLDGVQVLLAPVVLPHRMLIGFTAANGERTDRHSVSGVAISVS